MMPFTHVVVALSLGAVSAGGLAAPGAGELVAVGLASTGSGVVIVLRGSGPLVPVQVAMASDAPLRLFVDLRDVLPGSAVTPDLRSGPIRRVRAGVHASQPLVTRIVFELSTPVTFRAEPDGRTLTIVLTTGPPLAATVVRAADRPATAPPAPAPAVLATSAPTLATTATPAPSEPVQPLASSQGSSGWRPAAAPAEKPAASATAQSVPQAPPSSTFGRSEPKAWGRAAFHVNSSRISVPDRPASQLTEMVSSVTYQMPDRQTDGLEYGLDVRQSQFPSGGRDSRLSIYDGFVGVRFGEARMRARGGHMWLNDLGGLGSVAGALFEMRQRPNTVSRAGRLRAGVFGGLEPQYYEVGYEPDVRKYGGYLALDTDGPRRHVVGYIRVSNASITERSVLSTTNYLPFGRRVFVYQAAEYDLEAPAGRAQGGLTYFFANTRVSPHQRLDLQMTASRGRSLDVRSLSQDLLAGRPVSQRAIEGLLYQSLGGRATVEVVRRVRVYVGYAQEKNNRDSAPTNRWLVGTTVFNLLGSGLDFTASDSLLDRASGGYHSRYVSAGRQIGRDVYITVDYSTSLSVVRFERSDGLIIEMRPETSRYGASSTISLGRVLSALVTADYTLDGEVRDLRLLSGITYRFD